MKILKIFLLSLAIIINSYGAEKKENEAEVKKIAEPVTLKEYEPGTNLYMLELTISDYVLFMVYSGNLTEYGTKDKVKIRKLLLDDVMIGIKPQKDYNELSQQDKIYLEKYAGIQVNQMIK